MSRVILPFRKPLVFPGTRPGFDPNHPAAQGVRFSGVAFGNNFVNLLNAKSGSLSNGNTSNKLYGGIGPAMASANPAGSLNGGSFFTSAGAATPTSMTIACIYQWTFTSNYHGLFDSGPSGFNGWALGIRNNYELYNGTNSVSNLSAPPDNTPIFVIVSTNGTTINILEKRLDTGAVRTDSFAQGGTTAGVESNYVIGDSGFGGGNAFNGGIAAVTFRAQAMSLLQMQQWAQDPWAFWYPRTLDLSMMLSGVAAAPDVLMPQVWL